MIAVRTFTTFVASGLVLTCTLWATPGDVLTGFPTPGQCPTGLTYGDGLLWMSDRLSDSLYGINTENGEVEKVLPAPGFVPLGLAWDGEYLWCIDGEDNLIHQVNVTTGVTVKTLWAPTSGPKGLAWDGEYLWICDDKDDQIAQISIDDGTTIVSFPSPFAAPEGLAWDGKYLWCSDRYKDRIYMVETEHGEVLFSVDAPGKYARGLGWVDGSLWNVDYQADSLYKLVVDDGVQYKTSDTKTQELLFTHEFRNYGPGSVETLDAYIAVPEDRHNQKIIGDIVFSPIADAILSDHWGQEVAHVQLGNLPLAERQRFTMHVVVELSDVRWFVFPEKVGNMEDIPGDIRERYLVDEDKYRINDPTIQEAVKAAVGDETNPYWMMRKIYKYVRDNLYYERVGGWNVAPAVLERGNGSCSEYSFVFIAMCRAAGLPARYVGAVAIRGDDASTDEVFHRWCECYVPGYGWVPVDPSGGDQERPEAVAEYFGHLANRYLITTEGGGASEYLGWGYNSDEKWTSKGPTKIHIEHVGEWSPLESED
jgi:hypothetical protein